MDAGAVVVARCQETLLDARVGVKVADVWMLSNAFKY